MRTDWVPLSASALVIGAMALVFGTLINPADAGSTPVQTLRVADEDGAQWLAMAVMYLLGSVALTLGLPAVLTLFRRRGHTLGLLGVAVFMVGAVGTCGYAMLLVFFRAMVVADAVKPGALERVTDDTALTTFLLGWVVGFYGGVLLIAIALFVAASVPRWAPGLLVVFVVLVPFASQLGRVGMAVQVMALAIAFTGVATSAVAAHHQRDLARSPAF